VSEDVQPITSLDALAIALRTSAEIYQAGEIEDQRASVVMSLNAVHEFLEAQGIDAFALEPIFRPIDALTKLDSNGLDPIFAAGRSGGRPRTSHDQLNRAGTLAALADFWIRHHGSGKKLQTALGEATRAIRGRWSGKLTAAEIKSARALVSQEASDHPAVETERRASAALMRLSNERGASSAFLTFLERLNSAQASPALGNWSTLMERRT
jgi:hypothetical protein